MDPFWTAVALTGLAGVATVVGGLLGIIGRTPSGRPLGLALGLAAGVMTAVSFQEMLPLAQEDLTAALGPAGVPVAMLLLAAGAGAYLLLDRLLSRHRSTPDDPAEGPRGLHGGRTRRRLRRVGVVTAAAIGLHNIPEGFVTFAAALEDPAIGLAMAVAVGVHNVPEGVAVAVPVRRASGSRRTALLWAAGTGLAEPVGAIVCWLLLAPVLTPAVLAGVYAGVAGMMIALSLDALLPEARQEGGRTASLAGALIGVAAMVISLDMMG